ncbi:hypothetical protein, partial [Campylobacter concisus]
EEDVRKARQKLTDAMYKKDENARANGGNQKDDDVIDAEVE